MLRFAQHDNFRVLIGVGLLAILVAGGARGAEPAGRVILYTSVDEPYARPIVREFEKRSGIEVVLKTDTEASKSVGLAERVRAEKDNPQADVWWGNEPLHTVALAREGLLVAYETKSASDVLEMYRDAQHRWTGVGLRARVIAINSEGKDGEYVKGLSLADLSEPLLKGKIAMARPTAGTTGGHVAALYVVWGERKASEYFQKLHENEVKLLGGNGPVAEAVGRGTVQFGLTDNDDVASARREGGKIAAALPDQDGIGTLMIPTTVGLVSGARNPEAAKKLVDYLVSKEVEKKLIDVGFAGWSVRKSNDPNAPKAMKVDYEKVVEVMPAAVRKATGILEGRE